MLPQRRRGEGEDRAVSASLSGPTVFDMPAGGEGIRGVREGIPANAQAPEIHHSRSAEQSSVENVGGSAQPSVGGAVLMNNIHPVPGSTPLRAVSGNFIPESTPRQTKQQYPQQEQYNTPMRPPDPSSEQRPFYRSGLTSPIMAGTQPINRSISGGSNVQHGVSIYREVQMDEIPLSEPAELGLGDSKLSRRSPFTPSGATKATINVVEPYDLNTVSMTPDEQESEWKKRLRWLQEQLSMTTQERDQAVSRVAALNEQLSSIKKDSFKERDISREKMKKLSISLLALQERTDPSYVLARWLFFRALGLVYLTAFVSLLWELNGILGSKGILPVRSFLSKIPLNFGAKFLQWPTILWLCVEDQCDIDMFMFVLIIIGIVLSLMVIGGISISPVFALIFMIYLSFCKAHDTFYMTQFDMLLLEAGFLAILLSPTFGVRRFQADSPPSRLVLIMCRWLLFRVTFSAGMSKLNPTWTDLTAMSHHYETQPLPNPLSWYFHQLPDRVHEMETILILFLQIVVPLGIWGPRQIRLTSAVILVFGELWESLSGNYAFKNLLCFALCLLLLDDASIRSLLPRRISDILVSKYGLGYGKGKAISLKRPLASETIEMVDMKGPSRNRNEPRPRSVSAVRSLYRGVSSAIIFAICILLVVASVAPMAGLLSQSPVDRDKHTTLSLAAVRAHELTQPYALVGKYGMETVVSRVRKEIIFEGSLDGHDWFEFQFRYKPDLVNERPPFLSPFHSRLDWQLWYAAQDSYQNSPWIVSLVVRLLNGSPDLYRLLAPINPTSDPDLITSYLPPNIHKAPSYVRAMMYEYRFTSSNEGKNWWVREPMSEFLPPVDLQNPTLIAFMTHFNWPIHLEDNEKVDAKPAPHAAPVVVEDSDRAGILDASQAKEVSEKHAEQQREEEKRLEEAEKEREQREKVEQEKLEEQRREFVEKQKEEERRREEERIRKEKEEEEQRRLRDTGDLQVTTPDEGRTADYNDHNLDELLGFPNEDDSEMESKKRKNKKKKRKKKKREYYD